MLKVGITGGIGSGKSVVCQVFQTLGIPVFNADDAARYLMENDAHLISNISLLFGKDIYKQGKLDRANVSAIVFNDAAKLQQLNALVHPATISYAHNWFSMQQAPYVIKEAAIFFESGSNKDMDVMIGVSAPLSLRTNRAMQRTSLSETEVKARIAKQMDQEEKMKLCDYVIINDEATAIIPRVIELHGLFLQKK